MKAGLDIGYNMTKIVGGNPPKTASFPSVTGTPDRSSFALGDTSGIYLEQPQAVAVGDVAIEQSRITRRREDRGWIESDEWYLLAMAALTEMTTGNTRFDIVTGLPVAFFSDKEKVVEKLMGYHQVKRDGRRGQGLTVDSVRVIPQPFGTLLDVCLNNQGKVVDLALAQGRVGVIDCGGKTCNILAVNRLAEISRETASVNVGGWTAAKMLSRDLAERCPNLDLRPHEVTQAIIEKSVIYYGEKVDLSEPVDEILKSLAAQVVAEATQVWNGAAELSAVLVSGGGALLLGEHIREHFRHARVVGDPVMANARGFWKLAMRG